MHDVNTLVALVEALVLWGVTHTLSLKTNIEFVVRIQGGNTGETNENENWANPYQGMTPPSTQNLKELDLWVFFLICCSTFSFLPNVGLRLTLEYLTIPPSSVSPSSTTLIHFPLSGSILNPSTLLMTPHLYCRSHTYTGHTCLKSPSGRLSIQSQTVLAQAANQRLWYHLLWESEGVNTGEISQEWDMSQPI